MNVVSLSLLANPGQIELEGTVISEGEQKPET